MKPALGDSCLVLADRALESAIRGILPQHTIIACDTPQEFANAISGREQKAAELLLVPPASLQDLLREPDELRRLTRCCADKLWLESYGALSEEALTRTALHRAGFYEVASWSPDIASSIIDENSDDVARRSVVALPRDRLIHCYDYSSVGLYPNGQFQMNATRPCRTLGDSGEWLMASRVPIQKTKNLPWTWIYGTGKMTEQGTLSPETDTDPLLTIRQGDSASSISHKLRISGTFSWPARRTAVASGSLVGCYHGPGDSRMYLAMVEPQGESQVCLSLWRNLEQWEQLATTTLTASQFTAQKSVLNTPAQRQSEIALEITPNELRLLCGSRCMLTVGDDSLPRNGNYGARLHGTQLQLGQIVAADI